MYACRYCGTECMTQEARKGHEDLCEQNPLNAIRKPKPEEKFEKKPKGKA